MLLFLCNLLRHQWGRLMQSPGAPFSRPFLGVSAKVQSDSAPFLVQQGGYDPAAAPTPFLAQQRGYAPGSPISTPSGTYCGNQMQQYGIAPPIGTPQGLAPHFSSFSLGSVPGSFDAWLDTAALPRPIDGDVKPKSFGENCSSRFVRLTSSTIPNSQSLASRWHLPLGAVCSLAETPVGEEVPIVDLPRRGLFGVEGAALV